MSTQIGFDLVSVDEVRRSVAAYGDRYLDRVYTERERSAGVADEACLAACFAAKEAAMKALGRGQHGLGWRTIELWRDDAGAWPSLRLSGAAATLAAERGVSRIHVSITHDHDHAAAIVITKGTSMSATMTAEIREVLREHARLPVDVGTLDDDADLFAAGMSSHASVNVMLALEDHFDIEFPDEMLKRSAFESVAAIHSGVAGLREAD